MVSHKEIAFCFTAMNTALGLIIASDLEWQKLLGLIAASLAAWKFMIGFLSVIQPPVDTPQKPMTPNIRE